MHTHTQCTTSVGTVVGIDVDHDVVVHYLSDNRWTFNPIILKKVRAGEAPPRLSLNLPDDPFVVATAATTAGYSEGDFVKIGSDLELVKERQEGHGEWLDTMEEVGVVWGGEDVAWNGWVWLEKRVGGVHGKVP